MLKDNNDRRSDSASAADPEAPKQVYKVGPGSPPKEFQFKPGQSGYPKGAKRKKPTMDLDLKAALERALNKTITLKQGKRSARSLWRSLESSNWSPSMSKATGMPAVTCLR